MIDHSRTAGRQSAPAIPARRTALKRIGQFALLGGFLAAGGWSLIKLKANLWKVQRERTLMGTSVAVTVLSADREAAAHAIDEAFSRMAAVASELTRFDESSPLARLNRVGRLEVAPVHLRAVLDEASALSNRTEGAFDVTVLPVLRYFESLRSTQADPDPDRLAALRGRVDYRQLIMDGAGMQLAHADMAVTLDGIAKGYVVDQGIAVIKEHGVEAGLIDAGGDVQAFSTLAGHRWQVGIVDPQDISRLAVVVPLENGSISTSGNYRVFFSANRELFHLIDPHTGRSPQHYSSLTVLAERSVLADGMSTAASALTLSELRAQARVQRVAWLAISRDGAERWRSSDLPLTAGEARV